jgi:hypothetical protein
MLLIMPYGSYNLQNYIKKFLAWCGLWHYICMLRPYTYICHHAQKWSLSFSHSRMVYTLFGSYSSRAQHSVNNRPIDTLILVAEPASVMNTCILDLELAADKRKRAY